MSKQTCSVCHGEILPGEKIVRMAVEVVGSKPDEGCDPDYWSDVDDWDIFNRIHLSCAVRATQQGIRFPYDNECLVLPIEDLHRELSKRPKLKLVKNG